jgi:hypothetical protein
VDSDCREDLTTLPTVFPPPLHSDERRHGRSGRRRIHELTDSGRPSLSHWFREALRLLRRKLHRPSEPLQR